MKENNLVIHTDGGARGNPGPAGIGVLIEKVDNEHDILSTTKVVEFGEKIGETTNNVAEYSAVVKALEYLLENKIFNNNIEVFIDSTLVVNQVNGLFKVKNTSLREFLTKIRILEGQLSSNIKYTYIPREENSKADLLVNKALDS
ncbi:ribonuclease HI family protein [Patescibacteria group bacterium]